MARSFHDIGAGRVQIRDGGGGMSLFGMPFLCAGVFLWFGVFGVVPGSAEPRFYEWPLLVLMALAFTGVGGTLVLGRAWTTVDAARREVVKEWGLLWPMRRKAHPVDGLMAVSVGFQEGDSDSIDQYPIVLRSDSGPSVKLCRFADYATARACAVAVARLLQLDLEDTTTDNVQRIPSDQTELSFIERSRRTRAHDAPAEKPPVMRSTVTDEGHGLRIVIPNPPLPPRAVAFMVLPLALPVILVGPLSRFFRQTDTPGPVGWIFIAFLVLGFGILPAVSGLNAWLRSRFGRTIVTVSSQSLEIERHGTWRVGARVTIPAADIVDLDYGTRASAIASAKLATEQRLRDSNRSRSTSPTIGPGTERLIAALGSMAKGRGVTVKTRQRLTTFGEGLADDEIRYLHDLVRRMLVR